MATTRSDFEELRRQFRERITRMEEETEAHYGDRHTAFFNRLRNGKYGRMPNRGPEHEIEGIRRLLGLTDAPKGFRSMMADALHHLTFEYVILFEEEWRPLFSEEDRALAEARLAPYRDAATGV